MRRGGRVKGCLSTRGVAAGCGERHVSGWTTRAVRCCEPDAQADDCHDTCDDPGDWRSPHMKPLRALPCIRSGFATGPPGRVHVAAVPLDILRRAIRRRVRYPCHQSPQVSSSCAQCACARQLLHDERAKLLHSALRPDLDRVCPPPLIWSCRTGAPVVRGPGCSRCRCGPAGYPGRSMSFWRLWAV